ncbi:hypothetical protein JD844_013708 [Phrynosoma platyrhinos]|uniref:Uncharacterized protein n=1 Tax=Phrynosoma platyrhinos TaxID=52577 RepID=A0ABQ7TM71_PHRPL|nr:hypothetical protein JD844_013708 [Phrynosoma platyrhinos]
MDTAQETGITVFLVPEIKMEEQDPVSHEAEEMKGKDLLKTDRSRVEDNHMVKQEPEEEPSRNWDARLEEFLKTLQPPHLAGEIPQPSEVKQQKDPEMNQMLSQGETEANKQSRGLWVSPKTQPHLIGVAQLEYGTHLDATNYGKGKEKALAGDAAKLEMRRQRFRMSSYQDTEGPQELCRQLQQLCRQWLNPDRNTKERMLELVTLEQFLAIVPADMRSWLWENGPMTCAKAVTLAEDFLQSQQEARDLEQQVSGKCLRESGKENPLVKRLEKMEQLPMFLKTDTENNFLCQGEPGKTAAAKVAAMEGSASETELTDEQAQSQHGQGSPKKDTVQQLMKTATPQQQVPWLGFEEAVSFVSQKGKNVIVQCKYCLPLIKRMRSRVSSASSVKQHLKKAHPDKLNAILEITGGKRSVSPEEPTGFDDDSEDNDGDSDGPPAVRSRRCSKQNVTQKILDRTLMDYIVEEIVPLQTVGKPTFLALVRLGLPKNLTIMCVNTLRDRIEKRVASMRETLTSRMGVVSHVATTTDCWTDGKRRFLGVTAHWISPTTLKREFGALAFKHLKGCLTYSVLVKALRDIYVQYGIHDKVVCMTTDNGSSFVKAFQVFRTKELAGAAGSIVDDNDVNQEQSEMEFVPISEILDTGNQAEENAPELDSKLPPHHMCASYILNLVATHDVEAMISDSSQGSPLGPFRKHFCTLMRKCRKLWSKQNNSMQIAEYIYEQCGMYLTVPKKTRWKAVFEALMQLNKLLSTVPLKVDAIMERCSLARITADECLVLQEYTEIMGPLALSLDILQRENGMFMGYLLPTIHSLDRKLQGLENKPVPYTHCLPLLRGVREALRKRFAGIWENKKLLLAACLHPRFKLDWLDSAQTDRSAVEALLKAELKGAVTEITEGSSEEDQERDNGLLDFFDIRPQQGKLIADLAEEEISKYLKTPSRELSSLLAFPSIQQSFLKYNTGMPSSAAAAHLFCRDGNVMTVERHSLPDDIYEHLILLKQNRAFSLLQVSKHSSV